MKTSNASAADPREYLCLDNNARSGPDRSPRRHKNTRVIVCYLCKLSDKAVKFRLAAASDPPHVRLEALPGKLSSDWIIEKPSQWNVEMKINDSSQEYKVVLKSKWFSRSPSAQRAFVTQSAAHSDLGVGSDRKVIPVSFQSRAGVRAKHSADYSQGKKGKETQGSGGKMSQRAAVHVWP